MHALPGRTGSRVGNPRRCRAQHGALRLEFRYVHFTFSAYSITDRARRIINFNKGIWHSGTGFRSASHASCGEFRRTAARPSALRAESLGLQANETGGRSHGPLERINVRTEGGALIDLKQRSDVVAALRDFKLARAYYDPEYPEVAEDIRSIVKEEVRHVTDKT